MSAKQGDTESTSVMRQILAATVMSNKILASSYGTESGISDKRNGQTYFIEVGLKIDELDATASPDPIQLSPRILVNTARVADQVSPSLQDVDVSYRIGIDSFSIQYWSKPAGSPFPITISCPFLQAPSGARFFGQIIGDSGTALSATATTVIYGELPTSMEFVFGYVDPVPTDTAGLINTTLWPLIFNNAWLTAELAAAAAGTSKFPFVQSSGGAPRSLWSSANIYSLSIRLYVIPQITPRVRFVGP